MTDQPRTWNGHAITPKLTKEQEQQVIELLAQGKSQVAITEALGISIGRVRQVRAKRQAAEAQAILQATKTTPTALNILQEAMGKLIGVVNEMSAQLGRVTLEQRKMNKALYRRATENKTLRETVAKLKADNRDLKKFYHGKMGREWL